MHKFFGEGLKAHAIWCFAGNLEEIESPACQGQSQNFFWPKGLLTAPENGASLSMSGLYIVLVGAFGYRLARLNEFFNEANSAFIHAE